MAFGAEPKLLLFLANQQLVARYPTFMVKSPYMRSFEKRLDRNTRKRRTEVGRRLKDARKRSSNKTPLRLTLWPAETYERTSSGNRGGLRLQRIESAQFSQFSTFLDFMSFLS